MKVAGIVAYFDFILDDELKPTLLLRQMNFTGLCKDRYVSGYISAVVI